jgi:tRNA threonylcarbamoyladenosine biosynthesis protein TsaB
MTLILCLDTSTEICSVALASDGHVVVKKESCELKAHSRELAVFIHEILSSGGLSPGNLDAVAVSKGPGSYTGLRIGVSTAKGIAFGGNIPLIGIGTLDAMASGAVQQPEILDRIGGNGLICPMIDARRMEVYSAFYDVTGKARSEVKAIIVDEETFTPELSANKIAFLGNGAGKCRDKIKHHNAVFFENFTTSAENMALPAEKAWQQKKFEDVAYFEPYYLKDFVATIPRNKVFPEQSPDKNK